MKLPNSDHAVVDERKVRDYLLSPSHPVGRFKAAIFAAVGFDDHNWSAFRDQLLAIAQLGLAEPGVVSDYGRKYLISSVLTGRLGSIHVVTVWFIANSTDIPHLITVYPK